MERSTTAVLRRMGSDLAWVENLVSSASGHPYQLVVAYPGGFPFEAPKAFVTSPRVDNAPHRIMDGSLCLFQNHVAGAGPKTTALLVRTRAIVWFVAYEMWRVTGQWPQPNY